MRKLLVLLALAASSLVWPGAAVAANGDNLRQITADTSGTACPNIGVGIAFDGVNLLVSCYNDSTITAVRPTDGSQVLHYSVLGANSLGALAWDNGRKVIWACSGFTQVGTIDPVLHTFTPKFSTEGCFDGLAYDAADDTLWTSPDATNRVTHSKSDGTFIARFFPALPCGNSGIAVGGPLLYLATDGCSSIYTSPKDFSTAPQFFASFPRRLEDMECDNLSFAPKGAMWSKDAYDNILNAWEIPSGSCSFGGGGGGPPPDPAISATGTTFGATEGQAFTGQTVASFTDPDPNAKASEYSATIDWGDATTPSTGTVVANGSGGFDVRGDHTYSEEGTYKVTVTITDTDNPTNIATASSTANLADAALASKCAAPSTSTQAFAGSTATFTDADPGGMTSDYSATINWGDSSSSPGTVSTGTGHGPYTVSGTHIYTSTGTFTITTTIKDAGGSKTVATCKTLVFGTLAHGSFTIGDENAKIGKVVTFSNTEVEWWGSNWWKENSLSGGRAPSAFKGFAESSPNPPTCGETWTTDTGNSSGPPATVPGFMAVIAASKITQSGSTITGNAPEVVIVKTNPGYMPDPGHKGTGTVVMILCKT